MWCIQSVSLTIFTTPQLHPVSLMEVQISSLANMLSPKRLICTKDSPHGRTFAQPSLCLSQQVNFMQLSFTDRPQLPPEVTKFL